MYKPFIFLLLLSAPFVLSAQQIPDKKAKIEMNVELPDETEEAALLHPGELQLETGYLFNKFRDGETANIGLAMLRYGVSKKLELRLLAEDGKRREIYMEKTVQSTYPLAASAKVSLFSGHHSLPDITLITYLKLPFTSRSSEQNSYLSPIFLFAFENKLSEKWKLEYNVGIQQEAYSSHWVWLGNASLHYKIAEPVELFVEYFAQYDDEAEPQHNAGMGIACHLSEYMEVFAAGGTTVNYESYNRFGTFGFAVKKR